LLHWYAGISLGCLKINISGSSVPERPINQSGKMPNVTIRKCNRNSIWRDVVKSIDRISSEARLGLLSICDYRRPRSFETLDCRPYSTIEELGKVLTRYPARFESLNSVDQLNRPGNATYRFRWKHGSLAFAWQSANKFRVLVAVSKMLGEWSAAHDSTTKRYLPHITWRSSSQSPFLCHGVPSASMFGANGQNENHRLVAAQPVLGSEGRKTSFGTKRAAL
jgi:hypothetical protein